MLATDNPTRPPLEARNLLGGAMRILAQADLDLVHVRLDDASRRVQTALDLIRAAQEALPESDLHSRGV